LSKKIKKCRKKVILYRYVPNINELMSICDIIITKPGGVTTSEALAKKIPMIIVKPIPGQEESNTAYLTKEGAAIKLDEPANINFIVDDLLKNRDKLAQLRDASGRIGKPRASMDIAEFLLNLPDNSV